MSHSTSLGDLSSSDDESSYELIENLSSAPSCKRLTDGACEQEPLVDKKAEEEKHLPSCADPIRCDRTVTLRRGNKESLGFTVLDRSVTNVGDKALFQGLRRGDRIVSIDGVNVENISHDVVMNLLVGPFSGRHTMTLVVRYDPVRVLEEQEPLSTDDANAFSSQASVDSERMDHFDDKAIKDEVDRIKELVDIAAKRIERADEELKNERELVKAKDKEIEQLKEKNADYERKIEAFEIERAQEVKWRDEEIARLTALIDSEEQPKLKKTVKVDKALTSNCKISNIDLAPLKKRFEEEIEKIKQIQKLEEAKKAVVKATDELKSIRKVTSVEVDAAGNPPEDIAKTLDAVRILLADNWIVYYYQGLRAVVLSIDFIPRIVSFKTESISTATIEQMQRFTLDPEFSYEKIACLSPNCASMVKWVLAQIQCAEQMQRASEEYRIKRAAALNQAKSKVADIRMKMEEAMAIVNRQIEDAQDGQKVLKEALDHDEDICFSLAKQLDRSIAVIRRGHVSKVQILGVFLALNDAIERMVKTGQIKASKGVMKSMRCLVKAPGIEALMRDVSDAMAELGLIGEVEEDDFNVEIEKDNDNEDLTFENVMNQVYEIIKNELSQMKNEVLQYFY